MSFFEGQGVQVTSARFTVFGQMYPINNITSVSPFTVKAQRASLIVLGVLFGLLALVSLIGGAFGGVVLFGLVAAPCIVVAMTKKDMHGIVISTAGMQVRALTSGDLAFVQQVLAALHQAVASR